jgi:hypothetical protein
MTTQTLPRAFSCSARGVSCDTLRRFLTWRTYPAAQPASGFSLRLTIRNVDQELDEDDDDVSEIIGESNEEDLEISRTGLAER